MVTTPLNETWRFEPSRSELAGYGAEMDERVTFPPLEASLKLIGEHQHRLGAHRECPPC